MMYTKEPWNLETWNLKSCNWIVYMYASELHGTQAFVDQLDLPFFVIQGLEFEPWSPVLAVDSYLYVFCLQIFSSNMKCDDGRWQTLDCQRRQIWMSLCLGWREHLGMLMTRAKRSTALLTQPKLLFIFEFYGTDRCKHLMATIFTGPCGDVWSDLWVQARPMIWFLGVRTWDKEVEWLFTQ